jgi:hypothetical protein
MTKNAMKPLIKNILLSCLLISLTAWGALALQFGDSLISTWQTLTSIIFSLSGLLALVGLFWKGILQRWLAGHLLLFMAVLVWWLNISPSNQRNWQADVAMLASASVNGDILTMHNIRNFDYRSEFDYQPAYYDKTFNISKLQGVELFAFYWMGPAIAHTIISFDFAEQGHLAISIETRKQQGEEYSTIKGFFRQYELIYIVADERDVIRLRTNYRNNPPEAGYLYQLHGKPENGRNLLLSYVREINELAEKPTFYNTLLDNCTIDIWFRNLDNADHLPFSWKILISGYLPEYLYESKLLDQQIPFAELQKRALINPAAKLADQAADFSSRIRQTNKQKD